jgi:hypothetical protein
VVGELVRPKNIIVGLKRPSMVRKVAFHSSPGLIQMLLYPQQMLNLVKRVQLLRQSIVCGIKGETLWFCFVHLLTG